MGNPAQQKWEDDGFFYYVVARLPQVQHVDGKDITRSMRIIAQQKLPGLQVRGGGGEEGQGKDIPVVC